MVIEYRVNWEGPVGGPGVTVFHGRPSNSGFDQEASEDLAARAHAFFDDIKALIPAGYTLSFPGEAIELNTTTGVLEDVYTFTPPADVTCAGSGDWAAPAGCRVEWRTAAIVNGRRLRGRTYIVPIAAGAFDTEGTIDSGTVTLLTTAAEDFIDDSVFANVDIAVWSRTHGILADVVNVFVPDEASILRSRRD